LGCICLNSFISIVDCTRLGDSSVRAICIVSRMNSHDCHWFLLTFNVITFLLCRWHAMVRLLFVFNVENGMIENIIRTIIVIVSCLFLMLFSFLFHLRCHVKQWTGSLFLCDVEICIVQISLLMWSNNSKNFVS